MNEIANRAAYYARIAQSAADQVEGFESLYLGAKATAPTVDNEGDPLITGALYFNTTDDTMYVWDGTIWVATNFNQFTNFTATGTTEARNLVTRMADVVNVKDFGAVGDGVADDTAAIQAAFNFIPASGGEVIIPKGTYIISSTLNISNKPISIFGAGIGISTLYWKGVGMVGQNGINYTNTEFQPFLIQDLSIKALPNSSNVTQMAGIALNVVYPSQATVNETTLKLLRVEIRQEILVNGGGFSTCVYAKDAGRFSANNCNFASRRPLLTKGIHLSTGVNAFFPVINNCDFTAFEDAIYSTGPSSPGGTVIESSNFTACYRGITIEAPTDLIQITSNYFQIYKYGIYARARTAMITLNRVDGVDDPSASHGPSDLYGIQIDGTTSGPYDCGIISNNNIARGSAEPMDGIILQGSAVGTVVNSNTIGQNSAYFVGNVRYGIFMLNLTSENQVQNNSGMNVSILVYDGGFNNVVEGNFVGSGSGMLPLSGATPSITSGQFGFTLKRAIYLTQSSPTNVTNFLNGYDGQVITIFAGDSNSTIVGSSLMLLSTSTYSMPGGKTLSLMRAGSQWIEISRT
jgi:hypothetical protein